MNALYGPTPEGIDLDTLPSIHNMEGAFEQFIDPFLNPDEEDPDAEEPFTSKEIHRLIVNIVLYDASLDNALYGQDLPDTYRPSRLLDLINDDGMDSIVINGHPIFHWASERLFYYFLEALGPEFIRSEVTDSIGPRGNTYLHSYLESSSFRALNPSFVVYLLDIGFSLSTQNDDGQTPLHLIVYQSGIHEDPFPTLSKEERRAKQHDYERKRYNRFYRTMVMLFKHPTANIHIKDNTGRTVHQILDRGNRNASEYNDARDAYDMATGSYYHAIDRAKKQKLTNKLHLLPKTNTNRIRQMLGTNLERAQAVVEKRRKEKKQINNTTQRKRSMQNELLLRNTRRKKQNMHHELLSRKNNRSGGRRTKKQLVKKRHTRRSYTLHGKPQ